MKLIGVLAHYNDARGFGYIRRSIDAFSVEFFWLHKSKVIAGREHLKKGSVVYFEIDPAYVVPKDGKKYPWAIRAVIQPEPDLGIGAAALATGLPSEVSDGK